MSSTTIPADVTGLPEEFVRRLERLPKPGNVRRIEDLAAPLDELRAIRAQFDALPPAQRAAGLSDDIDEQLRAFEDKRARLNMLADTRAELEDRLASAQALLDAQGAIDQVAKRYADAVAHAGSPRQSGLNWDRVDLEEIEALEARADAAREKFLNDHERPTTRQRGDELAALIVQFVELEKRNPDHTVTYFNAPTVMTVTARMPVSEALVYARGILFNFWDDKIAEYLELARQKLEIDHQPRAARAEWDRCNRLPGRENPAIGVALAVDQVNRIEQMRVAIDAAIKSLDQAESELRQAENALEPPHPDPLAAEQHRRKAELAYPHVSGLERVRARIVEAARAEIPDVLVAVEKRLRAEDWIAAATALTGVESLLALQPAADLAEERTRHSALHTVYATLEPLVDGRKLSRDQEQELLEELEQSRAGDYWPGWVGLDRRLARLRTRRNLDALLAEAQAVGKTNAVAVDLVDLLDRLNELQRNPPPDAPRDSLDSLPGMIKRVAAWLGLARLRDELAKVPTAGLSADAAPDDLAFEEVADLQLAEAALAQAQQHSSAVAALDSWRPNLRQQLRELQRNDSQARRILEEAEAFLRRADAAPLDELRAQLTALQGVLARPNSYRQDLLAAHRDVRDRLCRLVADDLRRRLEETGPEYYEKLSEKDVEQLMAEVQRLCPGEDRDRAPLLQEATVARSLARARAAEVAAQRDIKGWDQVRRAWETARDNAEEGSDVYDYAHRRARLARKEEVFKEAVAAATPAAAAEILRVLTEDATLRDEWTVWFRHGRAVFDGVRAAVAPAQLYTRNVEALPAARAGVETARRSLRRALDLLEGRRLTRAEDSDAAVQLNDLAAAIEHWDVLLRALAQYQDDLRNEWPAHTDCLHMTQTHEETVDRLSDYVPDRGVRDALDPARWYDGLWQQVSGVASGRLENRLRALNDSQNTILDQLDVLLSQLTLFPNNGAVQQQLGNQAIGILRALQTLVDDTAGDYSAARFSQRFQRLEKRSPEEAETLAYQIDEARRTASSLEGYNQTLQRVALPGLDHDPQLLGKWTDRVDQWIDELENFNDALHNALRLAEDGLANPRQFNRANRILGAGQPFDSDLAQVPGEFIRASHPTYRWGAAVVSQGVARRQRQQAAFEAIEGLIAEERQGVALALSWRAGETLTPAEQDQVARLATVLTRLRAKLREMREDAPDDPTMLQNKLVYHLPETHHESDRAVRGAINIEAVVDAKMEQYKRANLWLANWADREGLRNVVNWRQTRDRAAQQRESGPEGLNAALRLCRAARDGSPGVSAPPPGELWPLRPALANLSEAGMTAAVLDRPASSTAEGGEDFILYGVTESLNQRRLALWRQLHDQLEENERMEQDILWRIRQFQPRLEALRAKKLELMNTSLMPWQRWADKAVWHEFLKAVEAFCAVCPGLDEFQTHLQEVAAYTHLPVYCPEAPQGGAL